MEAEVEQQAVDKKCVEIERKNLLIENENLIADCLSNELLYSVMNSVNTISRFSKMHDAYIVEQARNVELEVEISKLKHKIQKDDHSEMIKRFSKLEVDHLNLQMKYQHLKERFGNNKSQTSQDAPEFDSFFEINKMKEQLQGKENTIRKLKVQISHMNERQHVTALQEQNERFRVENEKVKQHYKELYDYIKITRTKTIENASSLLTQNEKLKAQVKGKIECVTMNTVKPKVFALGMYAIDIEPIPPHNRINREVHLDYLKHLKESVEILHEIIEKARIENPLDNAPENACFYTKRSQELSKQATFKETCGTSNNNRQTHVKQQKVQKTNVPMIPSTGVNSSTKASGSNPRRNTKNNRILLAKSDNKKKVEDHPRNNKSKLKQENHVESSISHKRTWKPTRKKFTLGEQRPLTRLTKSKVVPLQQPQHVSTSEIVITERFSNTTQKPLARYKRRNKKEKVSTGIPTTAEIQTINAPIVLWYLDLSCSKHMTGNRSRIKNFMKKFIGTVRFRNDHFGAIMGYGDYVISNSVISRVYYVEGLGHNLFSVGQYCDSDLDAAFRKHACYVKDVDGVELLKAVCCETAILDSDLPLEILLSGLPRETAASQQFVDILQNTNFFRAFTASTDVPSIYIQQFWNTLGKDFKTSALGITPKDSAHPFVPPLAGDLVIDFVNNLGYPEELQFVSKTCVNSLYQPWRTILSMINQCLTGKTSGGDRPRHPVLQMLWGVVTRTNVPTKKPKSPVIPYCQFTKLIIYYLGSIHNIHIRPQYPVHITADDYPLGNLKFFSKGIVDDVEKKKKAMKAGKSTHPAPAKQPKPMKNKTSKPTPLKKIRKGKRSDHLVDEAYKEPQPAYELQVEDDEYNLQRGFIRKLPEGEGKGKGIVIDEQAAQSLLDLHKLKKQSIKDQYIFQRQTLVTQDASTRPSTQPQDDISAKVVHDTSSPVDSTNDVDIVAYMGQSNSKNDTEILNVKEERRKEVSNMVALEERAVELDEGQAGSDPEEEPGKANVETGVESMVTVPIHQASSSVHPLYTPIINLSPPKLVLPLRSVDFDQKNKLQDKETQALASRVYKLKHHDLYSKIDKQVNEVVKEVIHNALQAPLHERFRDLSEFQMKEIIHDQMFKTLTKSRKRRRDDQDPPPPPPKDSDQSKKKKHDSDVSASK
ncbi:hypothetical protein Tco_0648311 [Tanacetum coccineum]